MVVLTQIGAASTTWTALGLARVSLGKVVVRDVELCWFPWAWLAVVELLSSGVAGYGVQLMGRLRSDSEEFCEAFGDIGGEDVLLSSLPWLFK